jgi:hypothetical protein
MISVSIKYCKNTYYFIIKKKKIESALKKMT